MIKKHSRFTFAPRRRVVEIVRSVQRFQGRQVNVTKSTDTTIDPNGGRTDVRTDGWLAAGKAESQRGPGEGVLNAAG